MMQRDMGRSIQRGCGVFFLAEILLFSIIAYLSYVQQDHRWDNGIHTVGIIQAIETPSVQPSVFGTKQSVESYTVQFEYFVDEDIFRVSQSVTIYFFKGQKVPILYLPETPEIAKIPIPDYSPLLPISLIGCIAIPIFSLLVSMWSYRSTSHASEKQKRKPHQEGIYDQTTL